MTLKHFIGLIAFSIVGMLLFAQPEGRGYQGRKAKMNPEAKKEIKAYMEKEVFPVLKPEREKLDSYIGETERNLLASIRIEMKKMREEGREFRKTMMEARKNGQEPSQEQIDKMRAMRKDSRLLMDQAWKIADEYEIEIYEILDGLKGDAEKWHKDLKAIHEKYKPEGEHAGSDHARPNRKGERPGKGEHTGKRRMGMGSPVDRLLQSPVQFLLWDGSTDMSVDEGHARVFPNPSQGVQTLAYKVKTAGEVSIELLDQAGTVVLSIEKAQVEKGEHEVKINTRGLKSGVYIYRITTADGTTTKKIQIN